MKQKPLLVFVVSIFIACNSDTKTASGEAKVKAASTEEPKMSMPIPLSIPTIGKPVQKKIQKWYCRP
jgi:hypothetical protein